MDTSEIWAFLSSQGNIKGGSPSDTNYITDEDENPITDEDGNNMTWEE